MDPAFILIVDDDARCRAEVARHLRELGHRVREAETASQAVREIRETLPDLVLIESRLPDVHGLELLEDIRRGERLRALRVVMTSRSPDPRDVVRALDHGADDFVGKPFVMEELIARVGACLRRPASTGASDVVAAGDIVVDRSSHRVTVGGRPTALAPREYRLMSFLVGNRERVYTRSQLLMHVWDRDASVGPRTVDVHIRRLRKILEPHGLAHYIQTVRGSGYRFSLDDD
ncbi:MAG: winged helix-turn-helix domain-containing protein [Gammaproteobacteria bacterium]|jgi:two-component system phosphate regulon response regulator PhoB